MNKKTIDDLNLKGKKVLLRVDFNVPIKNGIVQSDKRIKEALPTIKKIVKENGKTIILSHLGRIKNGKDKATNSLELVAKTLEKLIKQKIHFVNATKGTKVEKEINNLNEGEILLLQNTRYEDLNNNAESKNNKELGKYWASLGDVFINDAFGTSHRAHASNVGIATNIKESSIGYLIKKEIQMLDKGLKNPKKPFIAILGGAKVSDKINVINNLLNKVDKILIGGGMAYTFLKAQGHEIGNSLIENDYLNIAKSLLKKSENKIVLPIDHAFAKKYEDLPRKETNNVEIDKNCMGLDIGRKTIILYTTILDNAKTIFWNGPMGVAEFKNFKTGTKEIANAIALKTNVFSIIGGGDSAAAIINLGFEDKFSHISTGGGASLCYMEGKQLEGIQIIQEKR